MTRIDLKTKHNLNQSEQQQQQNSQQQQNTKIQRKERMKERKKKERRKKLKWTWIIKTEINGWKLTLCNRLKPVMDR